MVVLRSRVGLRTTGHDHDRALSITDDVFGDAADQRVLQSGAAMSGSDDEINVGFAGCGADFVDRGTGRISV